MSQFYQDSIFWIDVDKIKPNPFQPRREFDATQLQSLSDSIRQYGVLQALVVTRKEFEKDDGGIGVEYELIAGERRLRASKLAGLAQVPVLIKIGDESDEMKLELAIIENLQREDLNVVDRAIAFKKLADNFGFKHQTIADKIGKSREYVSNTIRILMLTDEILNALREGKISEGHTRPLMMLVDRPEQQQTLFKEIMLKKITVRESELIARRIALEKARIRGDLLDSETKEIEEKLTETLGTRVIIEKKSSDSESGKITINYFSVEDLKNILNAINQSKKNEASGTENKGEGVLDSVPENTMLPGDTVEILDDRSKDEIKTADNTDGDEELYSIKNFSI